MCEAVRGMFTKGPGLLGYLLQTLCSACEPQDSQMTCSYMLTMGTGTHLGRQ